MSPGLNEARKMDRDSYIRTVNIGTNICLYSWARPGFSRQSLCSFCQNRRNKYLAKWEEQSKDSLQSSRIVSA